MLKEFVGRVRAHYVSREATIKNGVRSGCKFFRAIKRGQVVEPVGSVSALTFAVAYAALVIFIVGVAFLNYFSGMWEEYKKDSWEYGECKGRRARRNLYYKNVQFVLWEAGEQGHETDYWYDFDSSHWGGFAPDAK